VFIERQEINPSGTQKSASLAFDSRIGDNAPIHQN
jgi:hypothetical protein